jgi:hypothetical protein
MSQNFQTIDPNARFIDLPCFTQDHPAVKPLAGPDEAKWEIREFSAAEEADFDELTKMFVPFEPDIL